MGLFLFLDLMQKLTFALVLIALATVASAQFALIPNGDFSSPEGQQWTGNTSDASISFPASGGHPGGYGLIDSVGRSAGWGGVLVQEGGTGPYRATGDGISLATLGLVAGETYTFQWEMKNFTPGSTLPAGIKLESWRGGNLLGDGGDRLFATTGAWVSHTATYTIDPEATALKIVMVNNQGFNGPSAVGFDNVGVIQTEPAYALSVAPVPVNGTVEGAGLYSEGAVASLRAVPDPGYIFSHWTGAASGSDHPLALLMDRDKTVGAVFVVAPAIPDPLSPRVASLRLVDGVPTIAVLSRPGYAYQLEASPFLVSGWIPLNEEQAGDGTILAFTDPTRFPANRFYRIRERLVGLGFFSLSNAAPGTLVTSNSILVTGLEGTATVSVSNGQYAIDGGAYTSADGTITNGQVLSLQQMTSPQQSTTIDTVITINGFSDAFRVATSAMVIPADSKRPGNLDGVEVWQLPNAPNGDRPDQCWLAVGSDPDGDIYISGHDHVNNSMLYRLHQTDDVLRWIGDAETASRSVDNWLMGESAEKFHTRPLAHDGRVYVATLDSSNMNTDYLSTRGFHWYGYEPLDNELLDLSVSEPDGVGWPTLQIVTIQKDPQNNVLYGMSVPTNELVRYDIDRAETTLLGKPSAWTGYFYSNRFMWVDSRGRVYITGGSSRPQWNQGESASTFDRVWYYDPTTGFGELPSFPLEGPNALEVGQWDRTGEVLYTADDQGNIYRFTDATASWSFVGRPDYGDIGSGVPKTWVFQLSADGEKIYLGVSDVSYPNSIWEYDLATGATTELAKLSELDTTASSQDFITGYDSWDADGSFYISSFSMYNGVNVYMLGINPVRLKAARNSGFELVEVSLQEAAGGGLSISRTGSTAADLEVLYKVTLFDAFGAKLQTLPGEVTIGLGQDTVELSETSLGLPSPALYAYAECALVADGNDYVLADHDAVILK